MLVARLSRVAALVAALLTSLALPAHAVTPDWVTVGDPGNAADTTGLGDVADSFQIMKFEWTNAQYAQFLNAVDASGTNPNAVSSTNMDSNPRGGISFTSGSSDGSKYAAKTNMGDKSVNFVSWFDAARARAPGTTLRGAIRLRRQCRLMERELALLAALGTLRTSTMEPSGTA
jgi:hypothetical protein